MLEIQHISKQYITGDLVQTALDGVSLGFRDNEFVAILGPSGSGKTTLLNIIGGLDRYDSGDLIINGISTKQYTDKDWDSYRNHTIGFVFQSYNLIPHQSVLANVELALTISGIPKAERRRRAKAALEQVGLGAQIHKRPNQMSGGQMQRVAIARALVNDPAILLADEPTGALDSETSVQVMDMLAEVAKDRLVIMVTHNPELAEQYATRIVRVKDGKVLEDSAPVSRDEMKGEGRHENMGRSSMSPLTALGLSFNNLRTKKGRTLLTSFAGSIGIIGIALILALSTGVNDYITDLQKDTMTAYPITIDAHSIDMTSLIEMGQSQQQKGDSEDVDHDRDAVYANSADLRTASAVTTSIRENNLTKFKRYLEDPKSDIQEHIGENGVVYSYDTQFCVYTYDDDGTLVNTDGTTLHGQEQRSFMTMMMQGAAMFSSSKSNNFEQLMPGTEGLLVSRAVTDSYDLVYGTMPRRYDELLLVLDENNELPQTILYQLGFLRTAEYKEYAALLDENAEIDPAPVKLDYKDLCSRSFYIVPACDPYSKNDDGTFSRAENNSPAVEEMLDDALELHIVGIIRPNEDLDRPFIVSPIGYTTALTEYLIDYTERSDVVRAQEASPDVNVLSGLHFEAKSKADKIADVRAYIGEMGVSEKAATYQSILMLEQLTGTAQDPTETIEATTEATESTTEATVKPVLHCAGEGTAVSLGMHRPAGQIRPLTDEMPVTEPQVLAGVGLTLVQSPDKTLYKVGEPLDLTGGVLHDTGYLIHETGDMELIDSDHALDDPGYVVVADAFDSSRPGIYPIYVLKRYTDADGLPQTASVVFYVLVQEETVLTTDPTEPPTEETTEAPTEDTTAPSVLPTWPTDWTLPTGGGFTWPTWPTDWTLPTGGEFTWPTLPTGGGSILPTLPSDITLPTLPTSGFQITPEMIQQYLASLGGTGGISGGGTSGGTTPSQQDLAALYAMLAGGGGGTDLSALAGLMGSGGLSLPTGVSGAGLSQTDLASMAAAAQGSTAGLSQADLMKMYAAMGGMDPSAAVAAGAASGNAGDLASMYAAMQNGQIPQLSEDQMAEMYSQMYGNLKPEDFERMLSAANMNETELAAALDEYMKSPNEDTLLQIYDRFIASGTYDSNMETFGLVSLDAPSSISIYVDSFEAKESIADCIKAYNEDASEDDQITYTDYIGLLMSSVTTIVNVISYVLIAFVSVSLIVSSIMIGIITYISVLERTKEIGILRAIGASKRNISQVFNAETFIIGLCSGLIGVGVSWLLLIPGNMLIHHLADSKSVSAVLPIPYALVLVLISVILTLIGGFIPATKAANKDPVTALRTE